MWLDGASWREVGEWTGLSEEAARQRWQRTRDRLKAIFGDVPLDDEEPPDG